MSVVTIGGRDSSTWRDGVAVFGNDNGTWRQAKGFWIYDAVGATWRGASLIPVAPTSLSATVSSYCISPGNPQYQVDLSWTNGDAGAYTEVYYSGTSSSGPWTLFDVADPGNTSYPGLTLPSNGTWYFQIRHSRWGWFSTYAAASRVVNVLICP